MGAGCNAVRLKKDRSGQRERRLRLRLSTQAMPEVRARHERRRPRTPVSLMNCLDTTAHTRICKQIASRPLTSLCRGLCRAQMTKRALFTPFCACDGWRLSQGIVIGATYCSHVFRAAMQARRGKVKMKHKAQVPATSLIAMAGR